MTPEEYAAKILQVYRHETGGVPADPLFLGRAIADVIRTTLARAEAAEADLARLQSTHADLLRVAQAAEAEARQQRGALRAALQSILAIAEARSDGTWDDVMRTARTALDGTP
jgi:hypothetical protein